MSNSLQLHESQHARPPCPSPTPGVHSDSRPSSQWCHPAISSSVIPFTSCPQSLPASESFPMSQLFAWGGQSTGVSALASVLPVTPRTDLLQNGLVGSSCSPRDSQESSPTPQFKSINSFALSLLHSPTLTSIHDHWKIMPTALCYLKPKLDFPGGPVVKNPPVNAGDMGSIPDLRRFHMPRSN